MKTYGFDIILRGIDSLNDEIVERVYALCDDCGLSSGSGVTTARFDREANSLESAIASALETIRKAGCEAERIEIDREDFATLSSESKATAG